MLGLLTALPVLYVCNVEEASAAERQRLFAQGRGAGEGRGRGRVVISAKIEAEIAVLSRDERSEYLAAVGLNEAGLDRLIRAGYALLDLVTFFTAGPKEARAWTVTAAPRRRRRRASSTPISSKASSAPRPSPTTIMWRCGGEAGARDAGKLRLEGKDYVVQDGDVMHFRFAT